MLLKIPSLLTSSDVAECRRLLEKTDWVDGRVTAGEMAAMVKNNTQIPADSPVARRLRKLILERLEQNGLFNAAAIPQKISPPLFNRYSVGQHYGSHLDAAIRKIDGGGDRLRSDLSATLFLSEMDDYDGGELIIEDAFGIRTVKLAAGDMILYPATSVHHVEPVKRGVRLAAFFWVQSMVRDDGDRTLLLQLHAAIQRVKRNVPQDLTTVLQLENVHNNLMRRLADT